MVSIAMCTSLNLSYPDGGSSRVVGLSNSLSERNDVRLLHQGDVPAEVSPLVRSKKMGGSDLNRLYGLLEPRLEPVLPNGLRVAIKTGISKRMFAAEVLREPVDIVHSHQHFLTYYLTRNRAIKAPVVFDIHGLAENQIIDESSINSIERRMEMIQLRAEKELIHRSDSVFTGSAAMNQYLARTCNVDIDRFFAIPDGFDQGLFINSNPERYLDVREWIGWEDKIVVGYIGGLSRLHDSLNMVKAFEIVNRELGNRANGVRFLIMSGAVDKGIADEFEAISARIPNLSRSPPRPHADLPYYLACADMLLIPYSNNKFSSLVPHLKTFEYMASGKPIVASKTLGNADVLEDGRNSIMADNGDPRSMASGIISLIDNPEQGRMIGQKARDDAFSRYTWERSASLAEIAYANILDRPHSGRRAN